jgi:hypothetical protein
MTRLLQLCFVLMFVTCSSAAADIDGTWSFIYLTPEGEMRASATLKAEGEKLTLVQDGNELTGAYKDGEFQLEVENFYSDAAGYSAKLILKGKYTGDEITGKWTFDVYEGTFSAKRSGT